jgi:hypothetical protein
MAGMRGGRRVVRRVPDAAALALLGAVACASAPRLEDGWYRDPQLGFAIEQPPGAWRRIGVDGTALALRGNDGETLSLSARCGEPVADPAVLARHLRFGLRGAEVRTNGAVAVDGHPAWMQVFDVDGEVPVRVKAVTTVVDRCVYDFLLVASHGFERAEPTFDAWWASFRAGPRAGGRS